MNRILTAGITGSVMILIILILRLILKNRLPKRTFVILWLIAAFRMLIPIQPIGVIPMPGLEKEVQETELQNRVFYPTETAREKNRTEYYTEIVSSGVNRKTEVNDAGTELTEDVYVMDNTPAPESKTVKNRAIAAESLTEETRQSWQEKAPVQPEKETTVRKKTPLKTRLSQFLGTIRQFRLPMQAARIIRIVYICGASGTLLIFLVLYLFGFRKFGKTKYFLNSELLTWLSSHKLRRKLTIKTASGIRSPLTYGILNPVILIPEDFLKGSDESWKYALEHEFRHIKNNDFAIKIFCALAASTHFYNPLAWLMFAFVNQDIEYACDEQVLHVLGMDSKKAYARTLLQMSIWEKQTHAVFLRAGFGKNPVTKRIRRISIYKRTGALAAAFSVLLAAILISCSTIGVSQKETESFANDKQTEPASDEAAKASEASESTGNQADEEIESFVTELLEKERKLNGLETRFSLPGCYRKTSLSGDGRSVIDPDIFFYIDSDNLSIEHEPLSCTNNKDSFWIQISDREEQNTVWNVYDGHYTYGEGNQLFELHVTAQHEGQAEQFLLIRTSGFGEEYQLYSREHLQDFKILGNYLLETDMDSEGRVQSFINIDSPGLTSFGEMRFFRDGSYDGSYKTTVLYDDEGSQFVVLAYSGGELKYYGSIPVSLEHGSKEPQPLNEITLFGYEGEYKTGTELGAFRKVEREDSGKQPDFLNYLSELSQPGTVSYLGKISCPDAGATVPKLREFLSAGESSAFSMYNAYETVSDAETRYYLANAPAYTEVSPGILNGLSDEMIVLWTGDQNRLMAVLDDSRAVLFLNNGDIHCFMPDTSGVIASRLSLRSWYDEAVCYAMGDISVKRERPVFPDSGQTFVEAVQEYFDLIDNIHMNLPHGNKYACLYEKSIVAEAEAEEIPQGFREQYENYDHDTLGAFRRTTVWVPENESAFLWQKNGRSSPYTGNDPEVPDGAYQSDTYGWVMKGTDGWHIYYSGLNPLDWPPDDSDTLKHETVKDSFTGTYVRIIDGQPGYDFSDSITVSDGFVTTHRNSLFNVIHREENGDLLCSYELEGVVYQKMLIHSEVLQDGRAQTIEVTEYKNDMPQETLRYKRTDYYEADYTGVYADPEDPKNRYLMLDDFGRLFKDGRVMNIMAMNINDGLIQLDAYDEKGPVPYQSIVLDPAYAPIPTLKITEADGKTSQYQLLRNSEDTPLPDVFSEMLQEEKLYIIRSEGPFAGQVLDGKRAANGDNILFGASNSKYAEVAVPDISGPVITAFGSDAGKRISLLEDYDVILYDNHGERHAYVRTVPESEYSALYSGWRSLRGWYDEVEFSTLLEAAPDEDIV